MPELEKYFNMDIDLKDPDLEERLRNMLKSAFPRKFKERMNEKQLLDKLIEGIIEPQCIQPTYITNHPYFMSPLADTLWDNSLLSDWFELFINKMEVANGYTEQGDPEV